jgi:glutamate-ammonia-ligase adenylyltransferase
MRMKLESGLGDILTRGRRFDRLAADTDRVRHKQARDIESFNRWDLESMPGGLNDIALVAAALQLRHAAEHPYVLSPDPGQALGALNRAGCLDPDTTDELIESYRFYSRILAVLAITGRADLNIRRPRPRLQTLIARAAGVSQFSAVEPLIIGHAERTLGHYKRLFLTPQNIVPERRSSSFRPRSA